MGSDSYLKTLVPGLKILKDFGIDPEVEITSAHRTPEYMAQYASTAAARGIKVIIAAAGGAAHLPGMAAAHTSLPVIGVPVKGSSLDGVDSLYSIVMMPRGKPLSSRTSPSHALPPPLAPFKIDKTQERSQGKTKRMNHPLTYPLGVPVATVGINNSTNAALLAARILGAYDSAVREKVETYAQEAKDTNLDVKGTKLRKLGWEKYFEQMKE
jgi:phosphoribosylaminoimidazole carboxylase